MRVIGSSPATVGAAVGSGAAPGQKSLSGVLHDDIQAVFPALARLADAGPCLE
jgi:hypothetical protein